MRINLVIPITIKKSNYLDYKTGIEYNNIRNFGNDKRKPHFISFMFYWLGRPIINYRKYYKKLWRKEEKIGVDHKKLQQWSKQRQKRKVSKEQKAKDEYEGIIRF